jgi:putative phosphoesterase
MRTLIISDVHANLGALRLLPAADVIICAGDIVTFGPDPADCIEWLSLNRAICVRGDEDDAAGNGTGHQLPRRLYDAGVASRSWTSGALSYHDRAWLSSLPPEAELIVEGRHVSVVHAYPGDYNRYLEPNDEELHRLTRAFPNADIIVVGHTHRPGLWRHRSKTIVNPGSVGQPPIPGKTSYALLQTIESRSAR